jgi:hypothetical protein
MRQVLSREMLAAGAPLVTAGVGGFLGPRLAARIEQPVINFSQDSGRPRPSGYD